MVRYLFGYIAQRIAQKVKQDGTRAVGLGGTTTTQESKKDDVGVRV